MGFLSSCKKEFNCETEGKVTRFYWEQGICQNGKERECPVTQTGEKPGYMVEYEGLKLKITSLSQNYVLQMELCR